MSSDQRHAPRYKEFIPVSVTTVEHGSGRKLAGPLGGRLVNISQHGACLLMSATVASTGGLTGKTSGGIDSLLEIRGALPADEAPFILAARAVWSAPMIVDDMHGWQMGVEFIDPLQGNPLPAPAPFTEGAEDQLAPPGAGREFKG